MNKFINDALRKLHVKYKTNPSVHASMEKTNFEGKTKDDTYDPD